MVRPHGKPCGRVVVDYLAPRAAALHGRHGRPLVEVERDVLGPYARLPPAAQRVGPPADEYARRLGHVVADVDGLAVDHGRPVPCLEIFPDLLALRGVLLALLLRQELARVLFPIDEGVRLGKVNVGV